MNPRPIFVLGSPRSGTTLVGALVASAPGGLDLGEYAGYDFCLRVAVEEMGAMPALHTDVYLKELREHAFAFPRRLANAAAAAWFVVSAPWNLLVAESLAEEEADALFLLCVREARGVCQSLKRSYESGRRWAGATPDERLDLYSRFYASAPQLPRDRTVIFDFDHACTDPERAFRELTRDLLRLGFPGDRMNPAIATESHANPSAQPTIARRTEDGAVVWQARRAWDPGAWSAEEDEALARHARVADATAALARFVGAVKNGAS